jgi:hypothetical protein
MSRVFISYSHNNGLEAVELWELLESYNLNPWIDHRELLGAEIWNIAIDEAIDDSYAMVVIATEVAMRRSIGVTYEWAKALGMGASQIKTILVYFNDRSFLPAQFNALHQLNYHDSDFRENLVRTLQKYQGEDGLINVRVPANADRELKALAQMAFNVNFPREMNKEAIDRLADMADDPIAREILLVGLNKREMSLRLYILEAMKRTKFDDRTGIPKLREIIFVEQHSNAHIEDINQQCKNNAVAILQNMGTDTIRAFAEEFDGSDWQRVRTAIEVITATRHVDALSLLGKAILYPNRHIQELAVISTHNLVYNIRGQTNFSQDFDEQIIPAIIFVLSEIEDNLHDQNNHRLGRAIRDLVQQAITPAALDIFRNSKGLKALAN